jgi:probable phosphoglycerate mutase
VDDLLMIRHGQSQWNVERRWQGWLDAPLTAVGAEQANRRAEALADAGFEPAMVHCSDLGRARQTAEIIACALGADVRSHRGLRERRGGEWEGLTRREIDARWPGMLAAWRSGAMASPPGGEDDTTALLRFDAAISSVVETGMPALVVTHHGVLRLVATRAGVDGGTLIPNLGGYWFRVCDGVLSHPRAFEPLPTSTELPASE